VTAALNAGGQCVVDIKQRQEKEVYLNCTLAGANDALACISWTVVDNSEASGPGKRREKTSARVE
jgi:hypothetical protein